MRAFKFTLRMAVGVVVFVAMLEFCARFDDFVTYGAPIWGSYSSEGLLQIDHIGKHGRPGARYKKWQLNSLGYRGPELRSGTVRIACFGASETFGLYEAAGQEFPRQLERDLNRWAGKPTFEVVNVSYPAQTVAAAVQRVPEVVEHVQPRFAVIYPFPASYAWLPSLKAAAELQDSPEKFEWRLAERIRTAAKSAVPEFIQFHIREIEVRLHQDRVRKKAARYPVMDRVSEENVNVFRADLESLVDALRQSGVEPVLATHATFFGKPLSREDQQMLTLWREWIPMLTGEGLLDLEQRMNAEIRSVAAERHIVLIDAAAEIPPGSKYFADFTHFTTLGAETMAGKIAEGLEPVLSSEIASSAQQNDLKRKSDNPNPPLQFH